MKNADEEIDGEREENEWIKCTLWAIGGEKQQQINSYYSLAV